MRRLLALGVGCLLSVTAYSEDLITIFDQAVVNDPLVREAEYTRKATREARPQAWAAYLPQINGSWSKTKEDGNGNSTSQQLIPDETNPPNFTILTQTRGGDSTTDTTQWGVQLRQSVFNWGQVVGLHQAGKIVAQADADYGTAQQDLALRAPPARP